MLERCSTYVEGKLEQKAVNHLHTRRRRSREFIPNANIGDFNMGDIILDLGSEVNVLPKKTWKCMGEPTLGYSPIQLKLANKHKVLPIGWLKGVTVDLDGVHTKDDLEVIEIVDGTTPYLTLLGLDWEFENKAIINMKTRKMTFDSGEYRFIAPLDPSKGERFVEPTCLDPEEINQLYRTIAREEDYVNRTAYGVLVVRVAKCQLIAGHLYKMGAEVSDPGRGYAGSLATRIEPISEDRSSNRGAQGIPEEYNVSIKLEKE
jgi:hypothetical protein